MKFSNKTKAVLFGILVLMLFLFIQLLSGIAGGIVSTVFMMISSEGAIDFNEIIIKAQPYILFVTELICILVFGIWYYLKYVKTSTGQRQSDSGSASIFSIRSLSLIICYTMVSFCIALLLSDTVTKLWPASHELFSSLISKVMGENSLVGYVTIILLAPISEELAFRGVILRNSERVFGLTGCIVLNAILFSIMHLNPLQCIYVIPIAVMLTYLAYKYNTVLASIIAHIINNSLGVLIPLFLNREIKTTEIILVMIIFAVPIYLLSDKRNTLRTAAENS
ncbi:CPBP family intramembrane glutamic endopeptidase [Oribacterium sp. WCC10]|uniref:CPBP family intramembrane glutamic endopeptidase n=1 Tax=Oribacterium sp. WCC10 TaxID=1855343 RepID=UPI0008E2A254|nr:type II CAAX endopeptidase family protein [Oribacterium sp. WCC10]SFG10028.1 Membrane protease YdiL, CAAX protease family [Oribacterium sp. WCC10]